MVAQFKIVLLAAIFAAARSQAPVGGPHGRPHVARYLRGEGREDEEAPALHYFAMWPQLGIQRSKSPELQDSAPPAVEARATLKNYKLECNALHHSKHPSPGFLRGGVYTATPAPDYNPAQI